jgi:para-aminobenzoate synthetase component 2
MKHPKILLIDNFDSFTYNLVDYFRQLGASVEVKRNTVPVATIAKLPTDLVVYSPGPGNPQQSGHLLEYIQYFTGKLPQFGVCLGLQAMVEALGGSLQVLKHPMHGKASPITHDGKTIFTGLPRTIMVGRYHSLAADKLPADFEVSARSTDDDVVMAIRHHTLPMEAVQFHPESILTAQNQHGLKMIKSVLDTLCP